MPIAQDMTSAQAAQFRVDYGRKHTEILKTTKFFKDTIATLKKQGKLTHAKLYEVFLALNVANYDVSVLVLNLALERDLQANQTIARTLAKEIFDSAQSLRLVIENPLQEPLTKLGALSRHQPAIGTMKNALDAFWAEQSEMLAAQKDVDGKQIDTDDILSIGIQFGQIHNSIGPLMQKILNDTSAIWPPELARS